MFRRKKKTKRELISVRENGKRYLISDNAFAVSMQSLDVASLTLNSVIEIGVPEAIIISKTKTAPPPTDPAFVLQIDKMFVKRLRPLLRKASKDALLLGKSERKKQQKVIRMFCDRLSPKSLNIQDRTYNFYHERVVSMCQENMEHAESLAKSEPFLRYGAAWASLFLMYKQTNVVSYFESQNDYEAEKTAGGPFNMVRGDRPYSACISTQNQIAIKTDGNFKPAICGHFSNEEAVCNAAIIAAFALSSVAGRSSIGLHVIVGGEHTGSIGGKEWKIQRGAICCFVQDGPESEWDFSYDY